MSEEDTAGGEQLTLKEFNEINYNALHTLGVHYFAEILKEFHKPIYLFMYVNPNSLENNTSKDIFTLVRAHTLEEAINKIIYDSDLFLRILLHIFHATQNGITKETNDYHQQLANLELIIKVWAITNYELWEINKNNDNFDQNYKKFIEQNYETLYKYFTENKNCHLQIGIHKIDKVL